MKRKTRIAWACLALQLAFAGLSGSDLLLCVGPGHIDVEVAHAGVACHPEGEQAAIEAGCTDTPLLAVPADRAPCASALVSQRLAGVIGSGILPDTDARTSFRTAVEDPSALLSRRTVVLLV